MKKGFVRISPQFIADALHFPIDWNIETMSMQDGDTDIKVLISGSDFPETNGGSIKECEIIVHRKETTLEVKEATN